jgi:uncharacterized repeat protein (TIGR03803 family)
VGNIFSIHTDGSNYTELYDFNTVLPSGQHPKGTLVLSASGTVLYGMTQNGGANSVGTIFSINTNGTNFTDLYDFQTGGFTGNTPSYGSLILVGNKLFGMTNQGGGSNYGVIFSINTDGSGYKTIWNFSSGTDGADPLGALTISGHMLFGMTSYGAAGNVGTVFSLDTSGQYFKTLLTFNGTNGASPYGDITISGRTLYGMTELGGVNNAGCAFSIDSTGSGYKDLWDFDDTGSNGNDPKGDLLLVGNTLYGLTYNYGGPLSEGCIFSLKPSGGGFANLYPFAGATTGSFPNGSLNRVGNTLYGMTEGGGTNSEGTIFSLTIAGLGVDEITSANGTITVYPNPNNGKFTVALRNLPNEKATIEVYNILGEQVLSAPLDNTPSGNSIDMSSQSNGVYLYKVITQTGDLIGQGKLVVQK